MRRSIASRLGLVAALLPMVACSAERDAASAPSAATASARAYELNNQGVEFLREGVRAQVSGSEDRAQQAFGAALDRFDQAIWIASERYAHDYDKAWANKAYVLWHMRRMDDAAAAAAEVRRINSAYALNPSFVDAMAASGHPIAPPSPDDSN